MGRDIPNAKIEKVTVTLVDKDIKGAGINDSKNIEVATEVVRD